MIKQNQFFSLSLLKLNISYRYFSLKEHNTVKYVRYYLDSELFSLLGDILMLKKAICSCVPLLEQDVLAVWHSENCWYKTQVLPKLAT